jgi:ABC-type bacteriocin/lantibiotic exporter with double-glycine peptidase domain
MTIEAPARTVLRIRQEFFERRDVGDTNQFQSHCRRVPPLESRSVFQTLIDGPAMELSMIACRPLPRGTRT